MDEEEGVARVGLIKGTFIFRSDVEVQPGIPTQ